MEQVRVITDSTTDLLPEIVDRLGITVVPLNVHFGDETFRDGVEITSDEFFERLAASRQMPKTSQPSVEAFRKSYEAALPEASGMVCITISGKLSGTFNSASLAARQFHQAPVRVIDGGSASMAVGFVAMAAAEAANAGATLDEVEQVAREMTTRSRILFFADTLEFLQRNGRIGRAQGLLGSMLQVKPVLTVEEGEVAPVSRPRTRGKAVQALVEWASKMHDPQRMAVIWSTNEDELNKLLDGLSPIHPRDQILVTKYGPVLGTHLGPGAMGVIVVESPGGAG